MSSRHRSLTRFGLAVRREREAKGLTEPQSTVTQHRERIFFVGFREWRHFEFPQFAADGPKLGSILEPKPDLK